MPAYRWAPSPWHTQLLCPKPNRLISSVWQQFLSPHGAVHPRQLSRLECLPHELLLQIAEHFLPIDAKDHTPPTLQDLATLCVVSKTLRDVATPLLYERFTATTSIFHLRPFLQTLLKKPTLGTFIKEILISEWNFGTVRYKMFPSFGLLRSYFDFAVSRLRECVFRRTFLACLAEGAPVGEAVLLLMHAPNLETLTMSYPDQFLVHRVGPDAGQKENLGIRPDSIAFHFFHYLTEPVTPPEYIFPKLQHVSAVSGAPTLPRLYRVITLAPLQLFVRLPSVKSFFASGICTCFPNISYVPWTVPGDSTNVSRVCLDHAAISSLHILGVINSSRVLEELSVRFDGELSTPDAILRYDIDVNFAEVGHALTKHQKTVRKRVLDTTSETLCLPRQGVNIGSLKHLDALEELEIDDYVLCGNTWADHLTASRLTDALARCFPGGLKPLRVHTTKHFILLEHVICAIYSDIPLELQRLTVTFPLIEAYLDEEHNRLVELRKTDLSSCYSFKKHPVFTHEVMSFTVTREQLEAYVKEFSSELAEGRVEYVEVAYDQPPSISSVIVG